MVAGTPLELWGALNLAQIEEYRYFGVRTIEQMAGLRDDVVQKIMGGTQLKARAINFLEVMKAEAPAKALAEGLAERDKQIAALQNALKEQGEALQKLQRDRAVPA